MELKVWFEGLPRIVCGVNEKTTCQDIVFALAQATGKTGRFTLIERWRNNDRLLAPSEVVMKWGEHSSDVQYVLQCIAIAAATTNAKTQIPSTSHAESLPTGTPQEGLPAAPPPYRNPPSPVKVSSRSPGKELPPYRLPPAPNSPSVEFTDQPSVDTQRPLDESKNEKTYKGLIHHINRQREKLNAQQADLTQHDAEIMFWETKARVQERNMETIMKEITRFEILSLQNEEQVQSLKDIEEESAVVSAESEALRQETTSLRQDLVKCEAELSQCKAKIKFLEDALACAEAENLITQVMSTREETDAIATKFKTLEKEYIIVSASLEERKAELDVLVSEIKEANLESLAMGEEESLFRGRRRLSRGSARQLKDAAPTAKNPHGVWV